MSSADLFLNILRLVMLQIQSRWRVGPHILRDGLRKLKKLEWQRLNHATVNGMTSEEPLGNDLNLDKNKT